MSDKNPNHNIIGVFDSGLGGLTILHHIFDLLTDYNYIYLGDNARLPYGEKSPASIYEYTREGVEFLLAKGCRLVIIACNTASAQALKRLQQEYLPQHYPDRRLLGVVRPLAEMAARSHHQRIGVIGTKATIDSQAYVSEIHKLNPRLEIEQQSAPLLVPLIENGWAKKPETKMILKKYLKPLKTKQIDALILGCTHYPFLYKDIKNFMGRRIFIPHPGEIVAASLKNYLQRHPELKLAPVEKPQYLFYTTDDPTLFKKLGEEFLGRSIERLEQAKITDL